MFRRQVLLGVAASALSNRTSLAQPQLNLNGRFIQGGMAIGRTVPSADIFLDGEPVGQAGAGGLFVIGFDRDSASTVELMVDRRSGPRISQTVNVAKGSFDVQRISGLPQNRVTPSDPALLAKIREQIDQKNIGLGSRADSEWFAQGFVPPLIRYRVSGRFGGQRILNGTPTKPHYGVDMASPAGTKVLAPGRAKVSLAGSGFHYEGGLVMLDHGQGLISMYLHMRKVMVTEGQIINAGHVLGEVGMEGRATGPHLCWRMSWRKRHLDPSLLIGLTGPAAS
jgi:murein DD-endopeptidase MepM/ murein hydrolase activator NlpD